MKQSLKITAIIAVCAIPVFSGTAFEAPVQSAELPAPTDATTQCASSKSVPAGQESANRSVATTINRGDRISLSFYEELQSQDDKWGTDRQRLREPSKGFQLHGELAGEYVVHEDGTILVPLLGMFSIEGLTPAEVQNLLQCRFEAVIDRKGFANVVNVVKQPIYIIGKVKNSGSFDYMPGMTVLHAVALAGGFDKAPMEPWQIAELTRQAETLQLALDRAIRMTARATALEASRTSDSAVIPAQLAELAGSSDAAQLVAEELAPRRFEMQALAVDEHAIRATVDAASSELSVRKARMPILQKSIDMRSNRVATLTGLNQKGILGNPVLMQAQTELLDVEDRRQETATTIAVAEDKLARAKQELQKTQMQAVVNFQKDLETTQAEARKGVQEARSAANIMRAMTQTQMAAAASADIQFQVIRRTRTGVLVIPAVETTQLEPGDLVQLRARTAPSAPVRYGQN